MEVGEGSGGARRTEQAARKRYGLKIEPDRSAAWTLLPLAAIVAAAWFWKGGGAGKGGTPFPRKPAEFADAATIDKRLEAVEAKLKAAPDDIQALLDGGILRFQKGVDNYPDAINELHEARRLGASDPRLFYYLGVMYQEEGLYAKAAEEYGRFLRNRPADVETRMLLAKLQFQAGQYEDAAAQYRRLLEFRPKDAVVAENLALSLWRSGKRDDAATGLTALAAKDPLARRRAEYFLGQIAYEGKDFKGALRHFMNVLPVDATPSLGLPPEEVHAALAANFEKNKLLKEAKYHLEKVVELDPKNSSAKSSLKTVSAALDKAERAAKAQRDKAERAAKAARDKAERAEKAARQKAERAERAEKAAREKAERAARRKEKAGKTETPAEKPADKAQADKAAAEKASAEKVAAEKVAAEKTAADKAAAEKAAAEKSEQPPAASNSTENSAATDKPKTNP
ncbi:MAG: tetratricopeptide repeat protein [Elusimicrobia bacterium]|nr:tetratricopeptide repeat protein [Elusimicrobiota bacterium]